MSGFRVAFQFLTLFPGGMRRPPTAQELGHAVGFFPLVGGLVGGLLALVALAAVRIAPPSVAAGGVLACWVAVTGALHLDGLLDACDGLFGARTREERLRIMRDEAIGAYALAGGVLLLLLKFAALESLLAGPGGPVGGQALIAAAVLGRWAMALAVVRFPYARPQGLGRAMVDAAGPRELALAGLVALGTSLGLFGGGGLALFLGTVLLVEALGRWIQDRLSGLTGDVYGALCELVELGVLLGVLAGPAG